MANAVNVQTDRFAKAWWLGFVGFLSILGFQAFVSHEPVQLFWFGFAGFFSFFRFRYEPLKYVGWLGIFGLVVAFLGVFGYISI